MDPSRLENNIAKLRQRIRLSAKKYHRQEGEILLLAVSKTRPAEDIRAAYHSGITDFGESYLQEALPKIDALGALPLTWHFIGPIQSNKTRTIAERFDWVHSVDREKIARRLSEQRPEGTRPLQVCLQVNISGEASKSGVSAADLPGLAETITELPQLTLRGLMAIPAATGNESEQRRAFAQLRQLFESLRPRVATLDTLSMGMSGDMDAAIAEGSTLLRIGTALFGPRNG